MDASTAPWLLCAFCSSLALHGVAYAALAPAPQREPLRRPPSEIRFEIAPPLEPAPVAKAPEPAPVPAADARELPRPARVPSPPPAHEVPADPEPAAALDLSGITLTNENGAASFSVPAGNGLERTGPVGTRATPPATASSATASSAAASTAPPLVAFADLSSRPSPPSLEAALRQHYPDEARRRGVAGSASVRVRVDPDGMVRQIHSLGETFSGFGEACRRTLRGSRWSPPRDHAGRAVATEVRYTCRFVVVP